MKKITFNGKEFYFDRKLRSHSLKLQLNRQRQWVLTLPFFVPEKEALQFITAHWTWIEKQEEKRPPVYQFHDNMEISLFGKNKTICHQPDARRGIWEDDKMLYVSGDIAFLHRRVCDYIKERAKSIFQTRALQYAKQLGVMPTRLTIRDTSSRWGSCSSTGHLSFCWKIALAPDFVIDYIIAHEIAHLKELNHSPRFWAVVASLTPHQADAHIWLRRHGEKLQALR